MSLSFQRHFDGLSAPLENPRLRTLALGLGVQSTALLFMSEYGLVEPYDYAIFAEEFLEPRAVYEHLRWLQSPNVGLKTPILTVSAGNLGAAIMASATSWQGLTDEERSSKASWSKAARVANPPFFTRGPAEASRAVIVEASELWGTDEQVIDIIVDRIEGGEVFGRLRRGCTRDYKIDPQTKQLAALIGLRPRQPGPASPVVEHSIGITYDELERISEGQRRWIYNRHPLVEYRWTKAHCVEWLESQGLPVPRKSRCKICPYQTDELWLELQREAPEDFAEAVAIDRLIRNGLRGTTHQLFLHRLCVPLDEIDFAARVAAQAADHDGFLSECSGGCGL